MCFAFIYYLTFLTLTAIRLVKIIGNMKEPHLDILLDFFLVVYFGKTMEEDTA